MEGESRYSKLCVPPALGIILGCGEIYRNEDTLFGTRVNSRRGKKIWHASLLAFRTF